MFEKKNVWETSYLVLSVPKTLRIAASLNCITKHHLTLGPTPVLPLADFIWC